MMKTQLKDKLLLNVENLDDLIMALDNLKELTISLKEIELHINDLVHLSHDLGLELIEKEPNKVYEIYDAKEDKRVSFEIDEETGNVIDYKYDDGSTPHPLISKSTPFVQPSI